LSWLKSLAPDRYVLAILGMVVLASLLPVRGVYATDLALFTKLVIALLFFLHGAKLSRDAVVAGLTHWRLHLVILASTFVLFPLLGLAAMRLPAMILPKTLATGVLFLCCLPSTVQSSIAFTSIARGNEPAAVCAAALSNVAGVFITPLLVAVFLGGHMNSGAGALQSIESIALKLLAPFLIGHLARPLVVGLLERHKKLVGRVDRGSILLVVYTAFSAAVIQGLWQSVSAGELARVLLIDAVLLAIALIATHTAARLLGFSKEDEIAIVFCGSKKSLASGVPMAKVLFPTAIVGPMILPLMLFHQIQLMACAVIAKRYAMRQESEAEPVPTAANP
jgi:sodium/bile acid cotransporter 7